MNIKTTFIYALVETNKPDYYRYIGKSDNPSNRLKRHIQNTKYSLKHNLILTHKDKWIIKNDFNIFYVILEECDFNIWQNREIFYINKFNNLTNTSKGGMGGSGIKYNISYGEIKNWVKNNLNIQSKSEWYRYIKYTELPSFIPRDPREVFLNKGWISWGDFLSTGNVWDNYIIYLDYDTAKTIIKTLNIKSGKEYKYYTKNKLIPPNIPNRPDRYYKTRNWISWGDFLGTGRIANQLMKHL